jgi:transposase
MPVRPYDQKQVFLLPPDINEWVRKDDPARAFSEIVDRLDVSQLHETRTEGRPHYATRMMVKILLWSYACGVRASRKIEQHLHSDVIYMWLAGMEKPDFRTICNFRRRNLALLEQLFAQILDVMRQLGMLRLGLVAVDGTKVRANAGVESFKKGAEWEAALAEAKRLLAEAEAQDRADDHQYGSDRPGDELPDEIRETQERIAQIEKIIEQSKTRDRQDVRISGTDSDARFMHTAAGSMPAFNGQLAVNEDQVILYSNVTSEPIDTNQLVPALDGIRQQTEANPDRVAADAGYKSGSNLKELAERGIDGYLPDREEKNIGKPVGNYPGLYPKEAFKYDPEQDCYECPAGQKLRPAARKVSKTKYSNTEGMVCRPRRGTCQKCAQRERCTVNRHPAGRSVTRDAYEAERRRMREKLRLPAGRATYALRKCLVEPVIGQLKVAGGFLQFLLRGIEGVRIEWQWATMAHNLRKIAKWWQSGKIKLTAAGG